MTNKIILAAIPGVIFLIALYMILDTDKCNISIEMPGGAKIDTRCETGALSSSQVAELEGLQQQIDKMKIRELEENKQLLQSSGDKETAIELEKEIQQIQQQDTKFEYLDESGYELYKQQFEQVKNSQTTPIKDENLNLVGTWNVKGFFKDGFDKISYDGTFTFNKDGTFTENNSVGPELYGSGTYEHMTLGVTKVFLKKAKLDFGFYTVVDSNTSSFRVTTPLDTADLTFTK